MRLQYKGERIIGKILGKLLLTTLGAFGLLGCDTLGPGPTPEYACPYADYALKGTVLDADSSKAIKGIKITFSDYNHLTAYSDSLGNWRISGRVACAWQDSLHVTDIDGNENRGTFLPDSLRLHPTRKKTAEDFNQWYRGSFEQNDIVITLKKTP